MGGLHSKYLPKQVPNEGGLSAYTVLNGKQKVREAVNAIRAIYANLCSRIDEESAKPCPDFARLEKLRRKKAEMEADFARREQVKQAQEKMRQERAQIAKAKADLLAR